MIIHPYCSDSDNESAPILHYDDNKEMPIFSSTSCGFVAEQMARNLLSPPMEKVCHVQPLGIRKNATFIVDMDDIPFMDLKSDDLGVWKTNGTKTTYFMILESGEIFISRKQKGPRSSYYVLTKRYYVHGTYQLFRRVIIDIQGESLACVGSKPAPFCLHI